MHHPSEDQILRHVDGECDEHEGQEIARHLEACVPCRLLYRRLCQAIESLSPPSERGLGSVADEVLQRLEGPTRREWPRWPFVAVPAALAMVVALSVRPSDPELPEPEFRARGGNVASEDMHARLGAQLFESEPGSREHGRGLSEGATIEQGRGLTFRVFNRTGKSIYLMLFAVDAARDVHWFYPAYVDARSNPESIRLDASMQVTDLPEGVVPSSPAAGPFVVHAVFSSTPLKVSSIEQRVEQGALPPPGASSIVERRSIALTMTIAEGPSR